MALTIVGSAKHTPTSTVTTHTVVVPAGVQAGDMIHILVVQPGGSATQSLSGGSGYETAADPLPSSGGTAYYWYKRNAQPSDANVTLTVTSSVARRVTILVVVTRGQIANVTPVITRTSMTVNLSTSTPAVQATYPTGVLYFMAATGNLSTTTSYSISPSATGIIDSMDTATGGGSGGAAFIEAGPFAPGVSYGPKTMTTVMPSNTSPTTGAYTIGLELVDDGGTVPTAPSIGQAAVKSGTDTVVALTATAPASDAWQWSVVGGGGGLTFDGSQATFIAPALKTNRTYEIQARRQVSNVWSQPTTIQVVVPKHPRWAGVQGTVVPYIYGDDTSSFDPAYPEVEALAPANDIPSISTVAIAASAGPTISGSAGWYREKRVGAPEVAVGATQTASGALDIHGSSYFKYPGTPAAPAYSTSPANYVSTTFKPGGSSQNAYWLMGLEFVAENTDRVQIRLNAPVANPRFGMIFVNGRRISETATFVTASAGAGYGVTLTFPSIGTRTIKIYGLNNNQGRFGGVATTSNGVIRRSNSVVSTRVAIIGDSFTNGAGSYPGGTNSVETFAWDLARRLGSQETIQAGIGGTGFVATINSEANSTFAGRIADVMSLNPHHVIFVGGRNDGNLAGLGTAVQASLDATSSAQRWVVSQDISAAGNTAIRNALNGYNGIWWSDISDVASSVELGTDNVHPTFAGHRTFANLAWTRRTTITGTPDPQPSDELTPATGIPSTGLFFELATAQQIATGPTPSRMVLAHFYGPQPAAFSNAASDYYETGYLPINGESGAHAAFGGLLRDRPLTSAPWPTTPVSWQRNMMFDEITAAKQAGLDGFFVNIMGSSGSNWDRYVYVADEASANFPGFKVVPMVDANGNMAQTESTAVAAARINTFLSKSCAWRLSDGRYVVGTFKMEGRPLSYWNEVQSLLQSTHGKNTAFVGVFNNINQATNYSSVQWGAGQWGPGADPNIWNNMTNHGTAIKGRGEKYLVPVWAQDIRPRSDLFDEARNTESLRAAIDAAIRQNADLIQMCTWSDYTEGSQIRPTVMRGHALLDIAAYRLTKWKTGKYPVILRDAMYVSHRNQMLNATITGGQTRFMAHWARGNRSALRESVEILTYFTAAANVTVKVGSATYTYTAPAGEYQYLAPMQGGEVSAKAVRSGTEIARVNSPVVIKTTSANQDRGYASFSSLRGTAGQYDPTPESPSPNSANYVS